MTQTYLMRTTGFNRSALDEGFELFAIDLSKEGVARLLGLIAEAKRIARVDPSFQFIKLKNDEGKWLEKHAASNDALEEMEEACESDDDLVLEIGYIARKGSITDRRQNLYVKSDAVFWGCNLRVLADADWLVDTTEVSETELKRIAVELDQPEAVFK